MRKSWVLRKVRRARLRSNAVAELQAMQAIQAASLDALEEGVAMVDLTGAVKLLNRAGSEILECTADQLASQWHERWETYQEDGASVAPEERPIAVTLRTGEPVDGMEGFWRSTRGTLRTLRVRTQPIYGESGSMVGVVAAFADVTELRMTEKAKEQAMQELEWRANHDPLTGLPTRGLLLDRLEARLSGQRATAVLFVDLDHFKTVNDSLGHQSGDELLTEVARRIRSSVRPHDTVARFGGDEFVVLAERVNSLEAAEALAARIEAALREPALLSGGPVQVSASIGVAFGRRIDPEALLRRADVALYRAKAQRGPAPACEPAV